MKHLTNQTGFLKEATAGLILTFILLVAMIPDLARARGGSDDSSRSEFYGVVQQRPEDVLQGEWLIGGRIVIIDHATEFNRSEGDPTIGSCVKVEMRNGRVHEIDSEPMQDCR